MADKTKNCGKGQLTSTDAKELYEAFMRNYEETMEEVGKQIDISRPYIVNYFRQGGVF